MAAQLQRVSEVPYLVLDAALVEFIPRFQMFRTYDAVLQWNFTRYTVILRAILEEDTPAAVSCLVLKRRGHVLLVTGLSSRAIDPAPLAIASAEQRS